jgi:hypothetical protein
MGAATINLCSANGASGVFINGHSVTSILAVALLVYTMVMIAVTLGGYCLHTWYKRRQLPRKQGGAKSVMSANFQDDGDYSHEALLGL